MTVQTAKSNRALRTTTNRAFTLIELLVVIAIIAILAAILFPVFAQAREKGRQASCLSNMKQIGLSFIQYNQDYDEVQPQACPVPGEYEYDNFGWNGKGWVFRVQPYIKSIAVFRCPSDGELIAPSTVLGTPYPREGISYAPNAYVQRFWDGHYGAIGIGGDWSKGVGGTISPVVALADIALPAETILLAERHNSELIERGKGGYGVQANPPFSGVDWMDGWFGVSETPHGAPWVSQDEKKDWPYARNGTVTVRHSGMANFSFVDGHVKSMKPAATCPDLWDDAPGGGASKNMWNAARK